MMTKESAAPSGRARLPIWRRLGWRLTTAVLLLTAAGTLASGLLQYRAQDRFLRESLGGLLLNIARTGALLVDGDAHEQVVRGGRNDTPEYLALRDRLLLIQATNQLGDAVYTLSKHRGRHGAVRGDQQRPGRGGPGVPAGPRDAPGAAQALLDCESCGIDLPAALQEMRQNFFMIGVQDFQDAYTLNVRQLMKCCVAQIVPDGRIIPFCAYNSVGYREQVRERMSGVAVAPVVPNAVPLQPLLQPTPYGSKTAANGNGHAPVPSTNIGKRLER